MFTGLIEEIGKIRSIRRHNHYWNIDISATKILEDMTPGDSISIDGACLSVTSKDKNTFSVDISRETLAKSKANTYYVSRLVNLERALKLGDRVGGHLVQGHVEGTGKITKFRKVHGSSTLQILLPSALKNGILEKGFISVDGISLTISKKLRNKIEITVINDTLKRTTLSQLKPGDTVNIERDFGLLTGRNKINE